MSEIYIKPKKKAEIVGQDFARLKDVADVLVPSSMRAGNQKRLESIKLIKSAEDGPYVISVLDMVKSINAAMPGYTVVNLGETDTLVSIKVEAPQKKRRALWRIIRVAAIALVLFVGSATAIMAFHTDSQLGTVFGQYYKIFFGEQVEKPFIINIPYSIGLALGIMVFFNHFGGRKITAEPTPIQVEMEIYEQDVQDALIENLSRREESRDSKGDK
jgi:stage V sporulation protein AA